MQEPVASDTTVTKNVLRMKGHTGGKQNEASADTASNALQKKRKLDTLTHVGGQYAHDEGLSDKKLRFDVTSEDAHEEGLAGSTMTFIAVPGGADVDMAQCQAEITIPMPSYASIGVPEPADASGKLMELLRVRNCASMAVFYVL